MMPPTDPGKLTIIEIYRRLVAHFGPLHGPQATSPWWPIISDNPSLEILIGAVLVQQTRWETVAGAVERMHAAGLIELAALANADADDLAKLIYPCAFYRQKASGLIALARAIQERYRDLAAMLSRPTAALRAELLQLPRIGPETADVILLYAGQHPLFVVDAYTRRIFARVVPDRLAWERASYALVQQEITEELPANPQLFADFHAQLNELAARYCLVRPRCDGPPARRGYSRLREEAGAGCPLRTVCAWYREAGVEQRSTYTG